ncbi:MAG: hypothetical protein V5A68_03635 [Candidatus Thermoplasmatota archaeon]
MKKRVEQNRNEHINNDGRKLFSKTKLISIFIITLMITTGFTSGLANEMKQKVKTNQENADEKKVTICLKKYDDMGKLVDKPIGFVTIERAYELKNSLKDIWQSNIPITKKTRNSIALLKDIENLDLPLKNFIKSSAHQNENGNSNTTQISTNDAGGEVFNFVSAWGAFCVGQPNVILVFSEHDISTIFKKEYPEGEGYNMSLFEEHGVSGLMLPFFGWGYFGTAGLFGLNTLQWPMFESSPKAFFACIMASLFLGITFKIGEPYISMFEVYFGLAVFPFAVSI